MTDNYDPLVNSGQMQLLKGDAEIAPGISVKVYPGTRAICRPSLFAVERKWLPTQRSSV